MAFCSSFASASASSSLTYSGGLVDDEQLCAVVLAVAAGPEAEVLPGIGRGADGDAGLGLEKIHAVTSAFIWAITGDAGRGAVEAGELVLGQEGDGRVRIGDRRRRRVGGESVVPVLQAVSIAAPKPRPITRRKLRREIISFISKTSVSVQVAPASVVAGGGEDAFAVEPLAGGVHQAVVEALPRDKAVVG